MYWFCLVHSHFKGGGLPGFYHHYIALSLPPPKVTGFSILIRVSYINTVIIESGKSTYATQFNRKKFGIFRYMTRRENYYRGAKFSSLTLAHQFHWLLIRAERGAIWAP
jgi:hypothetical protein